MAEGPPISRLLSPGPVRATASPALADSLRGKPCHRCRSRFELTRVTLMIRLPRLVALFAAALLTGGTLAGATDTSYWTHAGADGFAAATVRNLVLTNYGDAQLARKLDRLAEGIEGVSVVYAIASAPDGTIYAGTGPEGVLLRIKGDKVDRFVIPAAENVFAVLAERDGTLLVGTGGETGKVLRVRLDGTNVRADTVFEADDVQYVWRMARHVDGSLYVATGPKAALYEVGVDGKPRRVFAAAGEGNLLSLLLTDGDEIFLGTDPNGLVWSVDRKSGRGRVLFDAAEPEVTGLVRIGESLYAVGGSRGEAGMDGDELGAGRPDVRGASGALARQAMQLPTPPELPPVEPDRLPLGEAFQDPPDRAEPPAGDGDAGPPDMDDAEPDIPGGRPRGVGPAVADFSGDGSALYRLELAQGRRGMAAAVFRDPALFLDLVEQGGRLLVAAGGADESEGARLFQFDPATNEVALLSAPDARQIVALHATSDGRLLLGLANPGGGAVLGAGYAPEGTLTSEPLDAGAVSRFGTIQLDGRLPEGSDLLLSVRSGNTAEPDSDPDGWNPWSEPVPARRFVATDVAPARFFQYRLSFRSQGQATASVERVRVAYQLPNLAPQVTSLAVNSELTGQDVDDVVASALSAGGPSTVRAIDWEAGDPNDDPLTFDVYLRKGQRGRFELLASGLTEPGYSWDPRATGDGVYEVRVVAKDDRGNAPGAGLAGSRVSTPFEVDLTPPAIGDVETGRDGEGAKVAFRVADAGGIVARVEYLTDGDPTDNANWIRAFPEDNLCDSPQERFALALPQVAAGGGTLRVRAVDDSGNIAYQSVPLPPK